MAPETPLDTSILHPLVAEALQDSSIPFKVVPCSEKLADTVLFCEHYGYDLQDSANCLVLESTKPKGVFAACVVLATHKLNNGPTKRLMGVSKMSFAPQSTTAERTGQLIGGVTPVGLPQSMPVFVDQAVMERNRIIIGGGNRSSKIVCSPQLLTLFPQTQVHEGIARLRE